MKDKNGIEIKCENCQFYDGRTCDNARAAASADELEDDLPF